MAACSSNPTRHMHGDIYTNAFQHWNNIRNQLTSAIQDYFDACISLQAICAIPPLGLSSRSSLEQVLTGINSQLPSLAADEDRIRQAQCALISTRNKSQSLVPISALPIDVLYHIFDFASQNCRRPPRNYDDEKSLTLAPQDMVAAVSTAWRQASLGHSSLWSHLDLILCGSKKSQHLSRVRLQIERSQTAPLYIHVVADDHGTVLNNLEILGLLTPLKPRMRQLDIEVDQYHRGSQEIMNSVLNAWLDNSTLGVTKLLRLTAIGNTWVTLNSKDQRLMAVSGRRPASDRLNDIPFSLRTLVLESSSLAWNSAAFRNLRHLRVSNWFKRGFYRPTQSQILAVLAASPTLITLELSSLSIIPEPSVTPGPVVLNYLQELNLLTDYPDDTLLLCPSLIIGSELLTMRVSLPGGHYGSGGLRSFFFRTKITTLHVNSGIAAPPLGFMPCPQELTLCQSTIHSSDVESLMATRNIESTSSPWPKTFTNGMALYRPRICSCPTHLNDAASSVPRFLFQGLAR